MTDLPNTKPMKKPKDIGKAVEALKASAEKPKKQPGMDGHASKGHRVAHRSPPIC